jgi:hypothetical protein
MGLRGWVRRLEHACDCIRAGSKGEPFLEPPETMKTLTRSRDRGAALNQLYPGGSFGVFPYELEPLVQRGELVPHYKVTGRQLGEVLKGLSE